jgi:hypothetical protein
MQLHEVQQSWNVHWASYKGHVRVVLPDISVAYGDTTGDILAEQYQEPGMAVALLSGQKIWVHPSYVWPVENYQGGNPPWPT